MANKDSQQTIRELEEAVNMDSGELEEWLSTESTEESYFVGQGEVKARASSKGLVCVIGREELVFRCQPVVYLKSGPPATPRWPT